MNRLGVKTVITIIVVISLVIFAFIFTVGFILSNIDPENKLEGYAIAISFIGIFATFGGAYLGAKMAGKYTLQTVRMNEDIKREINEKKAKHLIENLVSITKDMLDRARPQDASGMLLFKENEYQPLNEFYIKEIEKSLQDINNFRVSENYFYLNKNSMRTLEDLYSIVFKLVFNINDLNDRKTKNENEKNPVFLIVKEEFFRNLEEFYQKYEEFLNFEV